MRTGIAHDGFSGGQIPSLHVRSPKTHRYKYDRKEYASYNRHKGAPGDTLSSRNELYKDRSFLPRVSQMAFLIFGEFQLSGIPATMALAAVALIGYLVGRKSRANTELAGPAAENLERALADARQLEQLTDDMLNATREALQQCRQLKMHSPARQPRAAEHAMPVG